MQYQVLVVVSKPSDNYSAYAPDVPGCVATGDTIEETLALMQEALQMHPEGTLEDGDPIPELTTVEARFVGVDVSAQIVSEQTVAKVN